MAGAVREEAWVAVGCWCDGEGYCSSEFAEE